MFLGRLAPLAFCRRPFSRQCCVPRQLIFASSAILEHRGMQFYRRELPDTCTPFSSPAGKDIFREALEKGHMESYFKLAAQFRTQDDPAFCGLATLVMVLNSLEVDPKRVWKGPWRWYHEEMLDCCNSLEDIRSRGITFDQFSCLAVCNGLSILEEQRVDDAADKNMFKQLVQQLTTREDRILVCAYSRKVIKQTGDGHYAAIGGYHPEKDLVLIFDTARFKYPPHWLSIDLLWESMQALDKVTQKPRGYFVLEKMQTDGLVLFHINAYLNAALMPPGIQESESYHKVVNAWHHWKTWTSEAAHAEALTDANLSLEAAVAAIMRTLSISGRQNFFLQVQSLCLDLKDVRSNLLQMLEELNFTSRILQALRAAMSGAETFHADGCCSEQDPKNVHLCVSAFVLAYPYPDRPGSWGCAMKEVVRDVIVASAPPVKDELARLNDILSLLIGFAERSRG